MCVGGSGGSGGHFDIQSITCYSPLIFNRSSTPIHSLISLMCVCVSVHVAINGLNTQ